MLLDQIREATKIYPHHRHPYAYTPPTCKYMVKATEYSQLLVILLKRMLLAGKLVFRHRRL